MPIIKFLRTCLLLLFLSTSINGYSAEVNTITTFSPSMKISIKAVVVTPESYSKKEKFPVVNLLHGHSGNYADWIQKVPKIKEYAGQYKVIFVCPDGDFNSWYFDSPVNPEIKYETYVASELVSFIDKHYSTIGDRSGRAITGLSMGGHGALYLAFKHQETFGIAGSMSGGVDLRPFPDNWELSEVLGPLNEYPERWKENSVVGLTHLLNPDSLQIIFACGSEDFFYEVNNDLHQILLNDHIIGQPIREF